MPPAGTILETYTQQALRTESPIDMHVTQRLIDFGREVHALLGLSSELGELATQYHAHVVLHQPQDRVNICEELGDVLWYLALLADCCGTTLHACLPEARGVDTHHYALIELFALQIAVGKLCDQAKRHLFYGRAWERSAAVAVISQTLAHVDMLAVIYGTTLEAIMAKNIDKLRVRFPADFTEAQAVTRNLDAERLTLEQCDGT